MVKERNRETGSLMSGNNSNTGIIPHKEITAISHRWS